jgi:hypothetical protein
MDSWGVARGANRRVAALALALLLPALATTARTASAEAPAPPSAARAASLSVTPQIYVAGQAMRFRGNVGKPGRRTVHLQSHMNRPGDTWLDVPDSTFRTNADGGFDFTFTAPSMFDISYRVAGPGVTTTSRLFNARPQEITLTLQGADVGAPFRRSCRCCRSRWSRTPRRRCGRCSVRRRRSLGER